MSACEANSVGNSGMLSDRDNWFVHEVLAHEAALTRYPARVWPDRSEIEDIRHDAYVRILESAHRLRPTAPKSLLFSVARNLMVDRVRRNRLPSRCQAVFWLRRIENLSQKEIAVVVGISEGTVEKHMLRALRLLADLLSTPDESCPAAPGWVPHIATNLPN